MIPVYDRIGVGYQNKRRPEPACERAIHDAIGEGTVLNVGAGSGSYEPRSNRVLAVEPSRTMLDQRPDGAAPSVLGIAEALPVPDGATDVALAVLTVHHWTDPAVRASISSLSLLDKDAVDEAMGRLADDLDTGAWTKRHADLLDRAELDRGYRLVVAEG